MYVKKYLFLCFLYTQVIVVAEEDIEEVVVLARDPDHVAAVPAHARVHVTAAAVDAAPRDLREASLPDRPEAAPVLAPDPAAVLAQASAVHNRRLTLMPGNQCPKHFYRRQNRYCRLLSVPNSHRFNLMAKVHLLLPLRFLLLLVIMILI